MSRFWPFLILLFVPFYLFRLHQLPVYQLPENISVKISGRISQQPYQKGSKQIIKVGPILVLTERFPGYFYGQKITVVGKFEKQVINPFLTQYWAYYPAISVLEKKENLGTFIGLRQFFFNARGRLEEVINQSLGAPFSNLLSGILLGVKREMPQEFWQKLRETGTLHVVVASGQNLSILAKFLMGALVFVLSRRRALGVAFLGILAYVLMTGAEPPVVRSAIMAGLAFLAQALGKQEEANLALLISAMVMLLVSPLILFDLGFQLSFAATAGILWVYPLLKEKKFFAATGGFGEALSTTLSAQAGVMPIILVNFGQVSLFSPLINGLVLWTIAYIMVLGIGVVLLGLAWLPLGQLAAWLVWPFLAFFVKVIDFFGFPWLSWEIPPLSGWWALGYYLVLGCWLYQHRLKKEKVKENARD